MSSSRGGHRRRERSWERDDRDRDRDRKRERYENNRGAARGYRDEKKRSSRSRSPRRGDRDRDNRRDRRDRDHDYRRDGDRRDGDRDRRDDGKRDRDNGREPTRRDDKSTSNRDDKHPRGDVEMKDRAVSRTESSYPEPPKGSSTSSARPSIDPNTPEHIHEDGEAEDDDAGMMSAMGLAGFGSTKGKHVDGNQEGATDVKKIRTWRQYMNRRGGFNRPLDKIK